MNLNRKKLANYPRQKSWLKTTARYVKKSKLFIANMKPSRNLPYKRKFLYPLKIQCIKIFIIDCSFMFSFLSIPRSDPYLLIAHLFKKKSRFRMKFLRGFIILRLYFYCWLLLRWVDVSNRGRRRVPLCFPFFKKALRVTHDVTHNSRLSVPPPRWRLKCHTTSTPSQKVDSFA